MPFRLFMGSRQLDRFAARFESHQKGQRNRDVLLTTDRTAEPLDDLLPVTKLTSGRLATATGHRPPATGHRPPATTMLNSSSPDAR
ncbi:hypothetical protein SUDANB6_00043 [Streptomyces sp. enrichment culture]